MAVYKQKLSKVQRGLIIIIVVVVVVVVVVVIIIIIIIIIKHVISNPKLERGGFQLDHTLCLFHLPRLRMRGA
jgi:predicted permease